MTSRGKATLTPLCGQSRQEFLQIELKFSCALIPIFHLIFAGLIDNGHQSHQVTAISSFVQSSGEPGMTLRRTTCGRLVKHPAKSENIRTSSAKALVWHISKRPDNRPIRRNPRHKTDVRQLRLAVHVNDVGRFYVAMNQISLMQGLECIGDSDAEFDA